MKKIMILIIVLSFIVCVIGTNIIGAVERDRATRDLEIVDGNLSPDAKIGGPYSGSFNEEISFIARARDNDGEIVSIVWNFGDGSFAYELNPTHVYTDQIEKRYDVSLTVTDNGGASTMVSTFVDIRDPSYSDFANNHWGLMIQQGEWGGVRRSKQLRDELLAHGWREEHLQYLAGEELTISNIVDRMNWLAEHVTPTDIVLITINGHGDSNGRFCLSQNSNVRVYYSHLDVLIDKLQAKGVAVILGGCYSGTGIPSLEQQGRVLITACKTNEKSNGIFDSLIISLQSFGDYEGNNDLFYSAEEYYNYLMKECNSGTPQIRDNFNGDLIIAEVNSELVDADNIDLYHMHAQKGQATLYGIIAQPFKPTKTEISKVKFYISFMSADQPLIVSIRNQIDGDDIVSAVIPAIDISAEAGYHHLAAKVIDAEFETTSMIPGETYYVTFKKPGNDGGYCIGTTEYEGSEDFESYSISYDNGRTWQPAHENRGLVFVTYK